jgi:hypothetical protein
MTTHLPKLGFAAIAALAISGSAHAAVTIAAYTSGDSAPAGEAVVDSFDAPIASGFTFTGGTVVQGTNAPVNSAPVGDTSQYLAVLGDSAATLTTPSALTGLSVYIGSIDSWNSISFYNTSNQLVSSFTGSDLLAFEGAPDDGRFSFDLAGQNIGSVVFGSGKNSMEFDDIAVSPAPEPGIWAMTLLGVGCLGYALRRRRTVLRTEVA